MADWFYRLKGTRALERVSEPTGVPEEDEFSAQTVTSCISPGTETSAYETLAPLRAGIARFPRLMGYMNVARVKAVGNESSIRPGDLVYTHKHHCQSFVGKDVDVLLTLREQDLSYGVEVLYIYRLALNALRRAKGIPGQQVLVVGSGAIGLASADLAKALSMTPTILSDRQPVIEKCSELGITCLSKSDLSDALDNRTGRFEGIADLVISTSNAWADWSIALRSTRFNGSIAVLGFPGRAETAIPSNPLDSTYFYDRQITVVSCGFGQDEAMIAQDALTPSNALQDDMSYLLELTRAEQIHPRHLIGKRMPSEHYSEALDALLGSRNFAGTISLDWSSA